MLWLAEREVLRVLKLWTQTVAAPIVSSFLFIVVFGLALSGRISPVRGVEYDMFIVPGLMIMAMAQAAYANNATSLFQARNDRYLNDVLAAPLRSWEVLVGLTLGGVVRALLIGGGLLALAIPATGVPVEQPLVLFAAVALALALFASLGVVVGIYAQTFDHAGFVNTLVILPLTFLGGVFYSVDVLPEPWREVSHANPIFYIVQAVRHGFLGRSDVSPALALAVTGLLAAAVVVWSARLFATGHRLKA
jgi:ABC-2 type transport system permease protein